MDDRRGSSRAAASRRAAGGRGMGGRARRSDGARARGGAAACCGSRPAAQVRQAMKSVVYDTGVLIAADRSDRRVWAEHRLRLEAGTLPVVPAPVVAQASRSPTQAQLRRFLRGCEVPALDE